MLLLGLARDRSQQSAESQYPVWSSPRAWDAAVMATWSQFVQRPLKIPCATQLKSHEILTLTYVRGPWDQAATAWSQYPPAAGLETTPTGTLTINWMSAGAGDLTGAGFRSQFGSHPTDNQIIVRTWFNLLVQGKPSIVTLGSTCTDKKGTIRI